ncbi:MAG: Pirin domain protein [Nocardioides sp.]|nr:Pirin domain protein [Nocardioides sp.]
MSNLEDRPDEVTCVAVSSGGVEVMVPREVPLGGPRAMHVRRTLPQRHRSLIGAWCFVDHYGPDDVADSGGMSVAPHPHTGLQTVSWLFTGEIEHRDSAGNHAMVRPGEVNLMTAGRGISHSEVSTAGTRSLHGAQLWVALPDGDRHVGPGFAHHAPSPVTGVGWTARVFLGSLLGDTSPVSTYTPLLGAELLLEAGATLLLDVDASFEHGVLVDTGVLAVAGTETKQNDLAYVPPGRDRLELAAYDAPVRLLLLGGPPFGESIVMWWNFHAVADLLRNSICPVDSACQSQRVFRVSHVWCTISGMKQIVPDKTQMRRYLDQGMSQAKIVEAYEKDTGVRVSRSAIAMAIGRYELKSSRPRPRYMETLPWTVLPEHRDHTDARMLRLEGRRREGGSLTVKELRWLQTWLETLNARNAVVDYNPRTKQGFWWVPREETDDDIVRRPA